MKGDVACDAECTYATTEGLQELGAPGQSGRSRLVSSAVPSTYLVPTASPDCLVRRTFAPPRG